MEKIGVKSPCVDQNYLNFLKFQEFNDDVEYIMEGLQPRHNISTRCLSTVTLATKCMEPPFR